MIRLVAGLPIRYVLLRERDRQTRLATGRPVLNAGMNFQVVARVHQQRIDNFWLPRCFRRPNLPCRINQQ